MKSLLQINNVNWIYLKFVVIYNKNNSHKAQNIYLIMIKKDNQN